MDDLERLRNACNTVQNTGWEEDIFDLLQDVEQASPDERRGAVFHRRIWDENPISDLPRGNIDVSQAISNMEFRQWLADVSFRPLPANRHNALEKIHQDLVDRVSKLGVSKSPLAKGTRLLAALFPRDFTTLVSEGTLDKFIGDFNKAFPTLKINPRGSVPYKHRQILDKLDEVLGPVPDDNLKELIRRMTLPYSLSLSTDDSDDMTIPQNSLLLSTDDSDKITTPQNIILYGPPGTGKTYSTTERALELILGKDKIGELDPDKIKSRFRKYQKKGQIEFVTFHQSYGYEEFVEGLRPVLDDTESADVRYELHDGVFKRIALRAAAEGLQKSAERPDFDDLWDQLAGEIEETDEYKSIRGIRYRLSLAPNGDRIRAINIDEQNSSTLQASRKNSKKLWENCQKDPKDLTTTFISDIVGLNVHRTLMWIVYKCLWKLSRSLVQKALDDHVQLNSHSSKQYVLIIDEINRGNMSKILGELITLLEPDKRLGEENELILKLPYSQKEFGVPPNLHILGTMNTADRSIALMDVALRRRFKFEELMPDAGVIKEELEEKLQTPLFDLVVDLFETLNKRIRFLYDRDHQLGHSYFLNVNSLEDLRGVFVDRVIPLLQEYFYGDWHKICTVLGCPYSEEGEKRSSNGHPIVEAEKFGEVDTLGFDHDEYEDRVDFEIAEKFLGVRGKMTDDEYLEYLGNRFLGVLPDNDRFDKSPERLAKLTSNEPLSDKKDDEGDLEVNH